MHATEQAATQNEKKGGELIGCETPSGNICSMPTSDGGKACSDSDECEEECVAPKNCARGAENVVGTCAQRTHLACHGVQTLEDGKCEPVLIW